MTLSRISDLPHALRDCQLLTRRVDSRRPVVFLDYDGTLTPIVDRPEDAVISEHMRAAVRRLTERTTVCVVSGRDRPVVARWMDIDGLVIAGSHGFDLGDHRDDAVWHDTMTGVAELLSTVTNRLRADVEAVQGTVIEPKRFSVAVHYRLVAPQERRDVKEVVNALLAGYPDQLKVTPGKMVYEIQPKVDWDKGKAVQYLRHALQVDGEEFVTLYLGDDITDEDAFRTLKEPPDGQLQGIGIVVADRSDPEQAGRTTAADFALESTGEVRRFLDTLAR